MLEFIYAVSSGCFAAMASTCAKLAMSSDLLTLFFCDYLLQSVLGVSMESPCQMIVITGRISFFLLVFIFNALMWTAFVKSLRGFPSSAQATITNTGSNFICTALIGRVLFSETVSLKWWLGTSLILAGLILIHHSSASNIETKEYERE